MEKPQDKYQRRLPSIVKKLRPIDDAMFAKLAENKDFCEELVQVVLENKNIKVLDNIPQYSIKNIAGRSVILDLKCQLEDNTICNVEVQKSDNEDHVRRANYNASMIETSCSERGSKFEGLPKTIIIFITERDFFGYGKSVYYQKQVINFGKEDIEIDTGRRIIYLNIQSDEETDIGKYIKQFGEEDPEKCTSPSLKKIFSLYKSNGIGGSDMCKELNDLIEEVKTEVREETLKEGLERGRIIAMENMIAAGIDKATILKCNYTEEEYNRIINQV